MIERWRLWLGEWASGYWFLPTIMLVGSMLLSFLSIELDRRFNVETIRTLGWIWAGSPDGARAVLSTISGSMITVAGVVFSITIAALSMTGSQFGPRLLRTFTSDRGNQLTLGTFTATFVYCLLILRTVRAASGKSQSEFVPYISVTIGLGLALFSVAILIYFIHHVSSSLQAETLVAEVGDELQEAIDRLFPQKIGEGVAPEKVELPEDNETEPIPVKAAMSGYIQAVSGDELLETMGEADAQIRLMQRPGDFVVAGGLLAQVWPREPRSEEDADKLAACCGDAFTLGSHRTPHQDISYLLRQLTEIAVRALSPGHQRSVHCARLLRLVGKRLEPIGRARISRSRALRRGGEFARRDARAIVSRFVGIGAGAAS